MNSDKEIKPFSCLMRSYLEEALVGPPGFEPGTTWGLVGDPESCGY